jgi:phage protein D
MSKSKKKNIKVRDLNPKKDAKGGFVVQTSKQQGNPNTGSPMAGAAEGRTAMTGTGKSIN